MCFLDLKEALYLAVKKWIFTERINLNTVKSMWEGIPLMASNMDGVGDI